MAGLASSPDERVTYPGARAPDRRRDVDAHGVRIAVHEWGDAAAPPLLLAHGGFDFARTFDVFAPLLADGGFRVVAWDQRGHGESEHTALYSWEADLRDLGAVLDATARDPVAAIGHSKGAGLVTTLIRAWPERFSRFVNLEGLPSTAPMPSRTDPEPLERFRALTTGWLDQRRAAAGRVRKAGGLDELARRRARMNPRLSHEWLRYLVSVGGRRDPDGWRWRLDSALAFGIGPWRPGWALEQLPSFPIPLLGIVALVDEEMAFEVDPDVLRPFLPPGARLEVFPDAGHFVHIERPREVAEIVLGFLS